MANAKTATRPVPAPIIAGFATLTEEALALAEALDRFDFEEAERLRTAVEVLAHDLDDREFHDWVDASGLPDLLSVMTTIKEWSGGFVDGGEDNRIRASDRAVNSGQLAEMVGWIGRRVVKRRRRLEKATAVR